MKIKIKRNEKRKTSNIKNYFFMLVISSTICGISVISYNSGLLENNLEKQVFSENKIETKTETQNLSENNSDIKANNLSFENNQEIKLEEVKNKTYNTIDDKKIIEAINKNLGGLLSGYGEAFLKAGKKNQVDSKLLAAIAIHETANGKSTQTIYTKVKNKKTGKITSVPKNIPSVLASCNNVCGMNRRTGFKYKGRYTLYSSIQESINDMAYWIKTFYIDKGENSIEKIGAIWAPLNDYQNGMYGMSNESWPGSVTQKYLKILNDIKK